MINRVNFRFLAATGLLVLTFALTGCQGEEIPGRRCGLVVDATSFARNTDVPEKVKKSVPLFLSDCALVSFAVITGSVAQSNCRHSPMNLVATSRDSQNDNPVRAKQINQARKVEAMSVMDELMTCAKTETKPPGSDVIGAILDARLKASSVGEPAHLMIISDMANRTEELDLYKADISSLNVRNNIISAIKASNRLPNLAESTVQIIGFGIKVTPEKVRQQQLLEFWQEFFAAAGCRQPTFL
ncbi:hypothetical protein Acor_53790 [Acrocarpospora corrugata]|uniref:VWA domain-containing protein n=1 Tax=Acrocarpospora corrugata TaxID=35763 RepID=A0A5M3W7Y9_9ACTN|nr:hypothetical protein [Acrocarpospora corrugata]GES03313.1 hypothetical protein Acor_53790 [Acrocarpospora corrugata]